MHKKTILITGSTDGIGRLTAEMLLEKGHQVILHGRQRSRVQAVAPDHTGMVARYVADFSKPQEVRKLADQIKAGHKTLDAVINNAGVLKADPTAGNEGFDIRFAVNTVAPYLLTRGVLPIVPKEGRVINVVSAAQVALDLDSVFNTGPYDDMTVYARSKLALVIWTQAMARAQPEGPAFIAVNPGSLLASKMVREGLGMRGRSLGIGATLLCEAVLDARFEGKSGAYFDNDKNAFVTPNVAAKTPEQIEAVMATLTALDQSVN